ncbi:MAG: M15 family metallopeptidase [Aerococcaceae bacterium]|nr:M15 family metallopeptidase [Aerococcaceae bacterium]
MKKIIRFVCALSLVMLMANPVLAISVPDIQHLPQKEQLLNKLPKNVHSNDELLVLVNRENRIQEEWPMAFFYDESGQYYSEIIAQPYQELLAAAAQDGFYYQVVSGYRSMEEQGFNRENRYQTYLSEGYSAEEALRLTDLFYAPANASEHTTGLALDILGTDWLYGGLGDLDVAYATFPSAQWLAENAHRFGFILRYTEGKTDITGYHYEPWHFRYVGKESAAFMYEHQLTLEEYIALLLQREATQ